MEQTTKTDLTLGSFKEQEDLNNFLRYCSRVRDWSRTCVLNESRYTVEAVIYTVDSDNLIFPVGYTASAYRLPSNDKLKKPFIKSDRKERDGFSLKALLRMAEFEDEYLGSEVKDPVTSVCHALGALYSKNSDRGVLIPERFIPRYCGVPRLEADELRVWTGPENLLNLLHTMREIGRNALVNTQKYREYNDEEDPRTTTTRIRVMVERVITKRTGFNLYVNVYPEKDKPGHDAGYMERESNDTR